MTNELDYFFNLEYCPDCGSFSMKDSLRCPECGLFHYDLANLPERDDPPPQPVIIEKMDLDPTLYSLNPNAVLPNEIEDSEEELPDPTVNWDESNTDFRFSDEGE